MKKKHEEHANHERWVVSYADFITLLFAFFVVLYAVSEVDKKKMKKVARAVQFAFHFKGTGGTEKPGLFEKAGQTPNEIANDLSQYFRSNPDAQRFFTYELPETYKKSGGGDDLSYTIDQELVTVEFPAYRLFDEGWEKPRTDGVQLLDKFAQGLRQFGGRIEIRLEVPEMRKFEQMGLQYARLASLHYYFCRILNLPDDRYKANLVQVKMESLGSIDQVIERPEQFARFKFMMSP